MSKLGTISNYILQKTPVATLAFNVSPLFLLPQEAADVGSFSYLTRAVNEAVNGLKRLVHNAYCIGQAITNPAMLLKMLEQIASNLMAVAMDMANRVLSIIEGQIQAVFNKIAGAINNIVSKILKVVDSVLAFMQAILGLFDMFNQIYNNLKNLSFKIILDFAAQEDCEFTLARMSRCFVNKLLGTKLEKLASKIISRLLKNGLNLNEAIISELVSASDISNFVRYETFMANKAQAQLNMMFT